MTQTQPDDDPATERTEFCTTCDADTTHAVSVELASTAEGDTTPRRPEFATAPVRIAECGDCGAVDRQQFSGRKQ